MSINFDLYIMPGKEVQKRHMPHLIQDLDDSPYECIVPDIINLC